MGGWRSHTAGAGCLAAGATAPLWEPMFKRSRHEDGGACLIGQKKSQKNKRMDWPGASFGHKGGATAPNPCCAACLW
eukprot:14944407-Alexandrium_andersonii.AAC.1